MTKRREANSTDEIEITPAMIEAGMAEYLSYATTPFPGDSAEEAVSEIFKAMASVASAPKNLDQARRP